MEALALELDTVLADTRPLWDDWLEDAARRARVPLVDVPRDRVAAVDVLDRELGDWRPLLERFAADRGPLHFRPRPQVGATLRRLHAGGTRIGRGAKPARIARRSRRRVRLSIIRGRWRARHGRVPGYPLTHGTSGGDHVRRTRVRAGTAPYG